MSIKLFLLSILVLVTSLYLYAQEAIFSADELRKHNQDKIIVICGASSGIGEVVAYKYASTGAKLVISARSADKLARVKQRALSLGASSVDIIIQDFSNIEQLSLFKSTVSNLHQQIDILVLNHAAIPLGPWTSFDKQQDPSFVLRSYQINVLSYIELTRLFLPSLEETSGLIQVTGSMASSCPFYEGGLYSSTKAALSSFFFSLQQELQPKQSPVNVSVFSFGLIMTKEMDKMLVDMTTTFDKSVPAIIKGDLEESANIIVAGSISRPKNVDYPKVMVKVTRLLANYFPFYDTVIIAATGLGYDQSVAVYATISEMSKKLNYQIGNRPS